MTVALDLCCGDGGWTDGLMAAGWIVYGFDINRSPNYKGRFVLLDVRSDHAWEQYGASLIVASPPCDEFSRHAMPWTRKRNPPPPDLSVVKACQAIQRRLGIPMVLENVREAQRWLGRAQWHVGPFYLWGDLPALIGSGPLPRKKESYGSRERLARARVPFWVAEYIGRHYADGTTRCRFCGFCLDANCGKYGCPNCHGEGIEATA